MLTSATLAVAGGFEYFRKRLGLNHAEVATRSAVEDVDVLGLC